MVKRRATTPMAERLRQAALLVVILGNLTLFFFYVRMNESNLPFALINLFLSVSLGLTLVIVGYWVWRYMGAEEEKGRDDTPAPEKAPSATELPEPTLSPERVEEYTNRLEWIVNQRTGALLESERKYRRLVDGMEDIVVSLDPRGIFTFLNPAWDRSVGLPREEVLGHPFTSYMHPDDRARALRLFEQATREKVNISRIDFRHRSKNDEWRLFTGNLSLLSDLDDNITGSVFVLRDMTEQQRMAEQLRDSQRLESIGLLASGLAHDFNNLFHEVIGFTHRIKKHPDAAAEIRRDAGAVEQVIERASAHIKSLLAFAANEPREEQRFDIKESLARIIQLTSRSFPSSIRLSSELRSSLETSGDPNQFDQVFLNLLINARDAMPEGGRLSVKSYDAERDERLPPGSGAARQVIIEVEDTGTGIAPEIQARVFDPFFTTKGPGKGTGLGLSTVYGVIRNHHGFIELKSRPGQGTRFTIGLPAAASDEAAPISDSAPRTDTLTVLLVDDDREIRDLTAEALQGEGLRVLKAEGGRQAIESYQAFAPEIDIVVMDRKMPEMDGLTALGHLRKIRSDCRVIISSGQPLSGAEARALDMSLTRQLQKPYGLDTLIATIRECAAQKHQTDTTRLKA